MTKGDYCQSKGLIIYSKSIDEEESDRIFEKVVDNLVEQYEEI